MNNLESSVVVCFVKLRGLLTYSIKYIVHCMRKVGRGVWVRDILRQNSRGQWFKPCWGLLFFLFWILFLIFYWSFLEKMFTFINRKHLMTNYKTCQNLWKGPFNLIHDRNCYLANLQWSQYSTEFFSLCSDYIFIIYQTTSLFKSLTWFLCLFRNKINNINNIKWKNV